MDYYYYIVNNIVFFGVSEIDDKNATLISKESHFTPKSAKHRAKKLAEIKGCQGYEAIK